MVIARLLGRVVLVRLPFLGGEKHEWTCNWEFQHTVYHRLDRTHCQQVGVNLINAIQ